jgi:hypothetical protein
MSEINTQALANLDETSRKEIIQWVESENSKSKVQMCKYFFPIPSPQHPWLAAPPQLSYS